MKPLGWAEWSRFYSLKVPFVWFLYVEKSRLGVSCYSWLSCLRYVATDKCTSQTLKLVYLECKRTNKTKHTKNTYCCQKYIVEYVRRGVSPELVQFSVSFTSLGHQLLLGVPVRSASLVVGDQVVHRVSASHQAGRLSFCGGRPPRAALSSQWYALITAGSQRRARPENSKCMLLVWNGAHEPLYVCIFNIQSPGAHFNSFTAMQM